MMEPYSTDFQRPNQNISFLKKETFKWCVKKETSFSPNYLNGIKECHETMAARKSFTAIHSYKNLLGREGKLNFQCDHNNWKKKAELKRRKIIQKLKKKYMINVEDLDKNIINELIKKVEIIEKEEAQRQKQNVQRTSNVITRLLEEQKCKRKVGRKKERIKLPSIIPCKYEVETENIISVRKDESVDNNVQQKTTPKDIASSAGLKADNTKEEDKETEVKTDPLLAPEYLPPEYDYQNYYCKSECPKETQLEKNFECTPKRVIFENYQRNEIYLQVLQIKNVDSETVHCRYLGILVHTKFAGRFPLGVAVRDNVKLRPGLSCSTKIRLCSTDDTKELHCSVVYETRRKNTFNQHCLFFVPVFCIPARAIVCVTPLKVSFPVLNWCEAMGAEGFRQLRKTIKIENTGGRACFCRIKEEQSNTDDQEGLFNSSLSVSKESSAENEIIYGEVSQDGNEECFSHSELIDELINELISNVFATFRFSEKYHIKIPPYSVNLIHVQFNPKYKGFHQELFAIEFEDSHNCEKEIIELNGDIKKILVSVEPKLIDLKICIGNSGVYAETFRVFNHSKRPFTILANVPKTLRNHSHVHPKTTIIQPSSHFDFSLRFYPRVTLSSDVGHYLNDGLLEFPILIRIKSKASCKSDCVKIYVFALITNYILEISPPLIDFGFVSTLETVRTSIQLKNHSLAIQEFAFLNLPKGIRVEPNFGFGFILPKECITLFLLYSPSANGMIKNLQEVENQYFQIRVTTLAECGSFKETLPQEQISVESIWGEELELLTPRDNNYRTGTIDSPENEAEEFDDFGECDEENWSFEKLDEKAKNTDQEEKIRNYLKSEVENVSEHSFFKRMNLNNQYTDSASFQTVEEKNTESVAVDKHSVLSNSTSEILSFDTGPTRPLSNVIECMATVNEPRCQLSDSVIQLPATPCSSFSLYRFRLQGFSESKSGSCFCGIQKKGKTLEKHRNNFEAAFEFQYYCPHFKLEPQSGVIKAGDSLPITIVYRPEFESEDLRRESRAQKEKKLIKEKTKTETSNTNLRATSQSKGKKPSGKSNSEVADTAKSSLFEIEKYDMFAGERSLQELINPFYIEAKVRCIVKIQEKTEQAQETEIHELSLICPAIKPKFVYLGNSQEIDFGKVLIGTTARILLEIQNISLERISPSISLLNPVGPFACLANARNVKVDPEHVWCQPITYTPLEERGVEKEYFEIYCETTNIFLTVKGEAFQPQYKFTPNFACCRIESKIGSAEEMKIEVENLSPVRLKLVFVVEYTKEGPDKQTETGVKQENVKQVPESKDKKNTKKTESERKNLKSWNEIPEVILNEVNEFANIDEDESAKIFSLIGLSENNEMILSPFGKALLKIRFSSPITKTEKGVTF